MAAATYTGGTIVADASAAHAAYRRLNHNVCNSKPGWGEIIHANYGMRNLSGDSAGISCFIPSDGYLPHSAIKRVNVHGYKNNYMTVRLCSLEYYSSSYSCTTSYSSSGHDFNVSITDTSVLANDPYGFPYLSLTLGYNSRLNGIYVTDY